jgi:hypothetical protein
MASTTMTSIISGNPVGTLGKIVKGRVTYTGGSASDTVAGFGRVGASDIILVQAKESEATANYCGIIENKSARSLANGTIQLVPVRTAPATDVDLEIIWIKA